MALLPKSPPSPWSLRESRAELLEEIRKRWPQQTPAGHVGLTELSLILEQVTGADSIPTVITHYRDPDRPDLSTYLCCYPRCGHRSRKPIVMWIHVHFSAKHLPRSFAGFRDPFQILDLVKKD